MDAVLVNILHAQGSGRVTATEAESATKLAGALGMHKEALKLPGGVMSALGALRPSPETSRAITSGLAASAATAGVGLGIHGIASGARALNERFSKKKDLDTILNTFPRLKEDYPDAEIQLAYNSIRHMNPHIAKDPLAGGSLLGQVLRQRDAMDPKTMRMEADLAGNLLRLRPEEHHIGEEIVRDAASAGMMLGFQEASKMRDRREQQGWQEGQTREERAHRERLSNEQSAAATAMKNKEIGARARQAFADRKAREADSARDRLHRDGSADKAHDRQVGIELGKMWNANAQNAEQRNFMGGQNRVGQEAQDRRTVLQQMAERAYKPTLAFDSHGDPVLDHQGNPVWIPGMEMEDLVSKSKAPSYLRQHFPHILSK